MLESHLHRAKVVCPSFFCAICFSIFCYRAFDIRIKLDDYEIQLIIFVIAKNVT